MGSKFLIFISFLIVTASMVYSQNNPGFLGKKMAVGYSTQYCLLKSDLIIYKVDNLSLGRVLTVHDFYFERAKKKHESYAIHLSYQRVPVVSYGYQSRLLTENYNNTAGRYTVKYGKSESVSDFRSMSIGLKYNVYSRSKTISAPIGFCNYLRVDLYSNKVTKNSYRYYIDNTSSLTASQIKNASIPSPQNTKTYNLSIGYGMESKITMSETVFLRLNGEFNLSSGLLSQLKVYNDKASINEELRERSSEVNSIRNMFLFGIGVGMLL